MQMFVQSRDYGSLEYIGKILDYQTPLKSVTDDEIGKIDLLSFDGKIMRVLELKRSDSKETMLRCVLEGFTYLKTADSNKLITDFSYDPEDVVLKGSPFVFYNSRQHKEMLQFRPYLQKLMILLDSKPYYIVNDGKYSVVEE